MKTLRQAVRVGLDILLPPRCANCGMLMRTPGLCPACWRRLTFIAPPLCRICGAPHPYAGAESLGPCSSCLPPVPRRNTMPHGAALDRGRAALVYDDGCRDLLLGFKHADRTDRTGLLARWMAAAGADLWEDADLIIPVPLHWRRLWRRQYNQAALLAQALARRTGVPCALRVVQRTRHTPQQKGLSSTARRRNVAGQFTIRDPAQVEGRRIVLVDDVWTTGATLTAVAGCLKASGARQVCALTAARVLHLDKAVDNSVENVEPLDGKVVDNACGVRKPPKKSSKTRDLKRIVLFCIET